MSADAPFIATTLKGPRSGRLPGPWPALLLDNLGSLYKTWSPTSNVLGLRLLFASSAALRPAAARYAKYASRSFSNRLACATATSEDSSDGS